VGLAKHEYVEKMNTIWSLYKEPGS